MAGVGLILLGAFFNMSTTGTCIAQVPLNIIGVLEHACSTSGTCIDTAYFGVLTLKLIGRNQVATRSKSSKSSYQVRTCFADVLVFPNYFFILLY